MTLLLVLGVVLLVTALVLLGLVLGDSPEPTGVTRSLAVLQAMTSAPREHSRGQDRPFAERVLVPLRARALALGRRLSGGDSAERIRRKLELAGSPAGWTVDRVLAGKVIGAVAGLLVGILFSLMLGQPLSVRLVVVLGGAVVGFFAPSLYLYQLAYDRGERLQRDLPDAIDLLTISVEAGLGFDAAIQQVAVHTSGPLADEFARALREMQIGQGRSAALRALAERTNVADVRTFVGAMVQADAFGIPISQVLRVQSREIRVKRRQRAEQKAQQVPVKMTVPLIFCILPCLFVAVLGPAVISIMGTFG
ncbi:MAG: Bacterial type secretion system protein domain protein [Nocardioides sp.]|nr:Bacterial type secretion system protein domain protein [Nocardioides sp.]